ncbi:class I SAM-dependent methyltransferase [Amycolatopsis sp. CA-230715]|uniref:class I SAM-dependent methyltransferase n=1 Tax=Amycolatopsis sp. CA-230715 TaxID=2745196 RepID=UPI001C034FE3|nr:class I SAM-dependent methyltransferase [Amycolatopsis sp. CA-230715]QWF77635.1 Ubiquinone biosynthesis O-methyltransferase [Amycolatopsis sp. CA-230715]
MPGRPHERTWHLPLGQAEQGTVLAALPDIRGRSVLDVGCGTGRYPRAYRALGAGRVVGVDPARELVSRAQNIEEHDPEGVSYETHALFSLPVLGKFDIVVAIRVLGATEDEDELDRVLRGLTANLAAGGTLVVLVAERNQSETQERYGFSVTEGAASDHRLAVTTLVRADPAVEFEDFVLCRGVVEAALVRAGLTDLERHDAIVPPEALLERGRDYWAALLADPPFAVFSARKCTP